MSNPNSEPVCPSSRDQFIYFQVRIEGSTQRQVADMFELTQARVSQIVRDVARWHVAQGGEPAEETAARRRRLADFDECHRLRRLYEMTIHELDRLNQPEVERKLGRRGHEEWDEMSYRPPKGRVQLLKLARNLVHDLHGAEHRVRGLLEEVEEAGGSGQEPVARSQEPGDRGQIYTDACPGNESMTQEPIAASHQERDSYDAQSDHKSNGHAACPAEKNRTRINRFDYGISENLPPITRVLFRGLRAKEEVQEAMGS